MAENRLESSTPSFACAWLGAILVPINTATRGPQLEHVLRTPRRASSSIEAALPGAPRRPRERFRRSSSASGCSTASPAGVRGRPLEAVPAQADAVPAPRVDPGDTVAILYTSGTTGPVEGRDVPAGAVLLVGRRHRWMLGGLERRRALHLPAAVPHQRAEHVRAGADPRREVRRRAALLGVARSGPRLEPTRPSPTCSARWSRSSSKPPDAREREHRVRVALAPATSAELPRVRGALRHRDRRGPRHDRDERRHRRRATACSGPARWGA